MSEFKRLGNYYVSEWNGNSGNDGSNPITPYAHPADAPNSNSNIIILGSGYYGGGWSGDRAVNGDGLVVLDGLGGNLQVRSSSENIHFKNCIIVGLTTNTSNKANDCVFENCQYFPCETFGSTNIVVASKRNVLLPNNIGLIKPLAGNKSWITNSLLLENYSGGLSTTTNQNFRIEYCYLPKNKKITFLNSSVAIDRTTYFRNNLINGIINADGIDYELKFLKDGSPRPDSDPLIPDLATASNFANCYANGNFAGEAKIIDAVNRLVEPDSDLLKDLSAEGYIGGVKPARYIGVNSISSDVTIESARIDTSNPTNFIIEAGQNDGEIVITYKTDTITEVQAIFLDALLAIDGSALGGSVGNNNVPDIFPASYAPLSQPGLKPNRRLFAFRTSQSIAKPTLETQWDNDNVVLGTTPGAWYYMEWNIKPTIHGSMGNYYGNGNPESIGISGNSFNARWRQLKVRLTNLRSFT